MKSQDPNRRHSVVKFTQSFYFRGHLCISTELLGMNLYEFIKAHDFKGFSLKLIRQFTKQLLSSLILLYGKKVIHCDLKPENILLAHPMRSEGLHVYSEPILPFSGGHSWYVIRNADRHVESGLYPGRTIYWLSDIPRRERTGAAGLYHGSLWSTREASDRQEHPQKAVL
jgi:serine/threonine protein kinase